MSAALVVALPGEWWPIAVDDPATVEASVRALVDEHYGRRDQDAAIRYAHRAQLREAALLAVNGRATALQISKTTESGVALATVYTEYLPNLPLGARSEAATVAERLVAVLSGLGGDAPASEHWAEFVATGGVVFEKDGGLVLRQTRTAPASDDGRRPAHVTIDYWLTVPERAAVVLATFSSVLVELAPLLIELFDEVIGAAEWAVSPPSELRSEIMSGSS